MDTTQPAEPTWVAAAEHAVTLASAQPEQARAEATRLLDATSEPEPLAIAHRAFGLACKELGDLDVARTHLGAGVRIADAAGLVRRAAQARMSLVAVLADAGDTRGALEQADAAGRVLRGADAGRLLAQRALVLGRAGQLDQAVESYRQALRRVRRAGDTRFEAGIRNNLGTLLVYLGALRQAESELNACVEMATDAGLDHLATMARANIAFAAMRRGDLPRSLALFDQVEAGLEASDERLAALRIDRAEGLLAARLAVEARDILTPNLATLRDSGFAADLAEGHLMLARSEMFDGDAQAAARTARTASDSFRHQDRTGWALLAGEIEIQARWHTGERSAALRHDAARLAAGLQRRGWVVPAAHTRIVAARVALACGELATAERELDAAGTARRAGPVGLRVAAWHAAALWRLAHGDRRGAFAALRAGLRVVADHAASLGATDLRTGAAGWGQELATQGVTLALETRRPRTVLAWVERWRAGAIRTAPVRPPDDSRLATDLAELRRVVAELMRAAADGQDTSRLTAAQVRLEHKVRARSRHLHGTGRADLREPSFERLATGLGERALVEYVRHGEELLAVTVVRGRCRLWHLGSYETAVRYVSALRFCLHRLARRHGSAASQQAARTGLDHAAGHLERQLLAPLRSEVTDRELVIAATANLHALPWSALPTLAGRPVTAVPSAQVWLDVSTRANEPAPDDRTHPDAGHRGSRTLLVAGPDLAHAGVEVDTLARRYPHARTLTGEAASAGAVRTALDGTALAHIAAHGRFRADNPLFSSLDLADGPLMVYDLQRLHSAPRRMVLSACDTALSAVHAGDELMGIASALLAAGTTTLVASVSPVDDGETQAMMTAFHERLAAGLTPARALAAATRTSGVLGFVCFGAG